MLQLDVLLEERPWRPAFADRVKGADLRFAQVRDVSSAFKPFVRDLAFDCGELAIATYIQAISQDVPLVLLPFVVSGRPAHRSLFCRIDGGVSDASQLEGRTIGIRSYSQASGMWVRSILQHEYGVDPARMNWITLEDAHVAGFADPPWCQRATLGSSLKEMLLSGLIDVAIMGSKAPDDPAIARLIPDADARGKAWIERHGAWPINHMLVVSQALCDAQPDLVRSICDAMRATRDAASDPFPIGFDGDWQALDLACQYAFEQGLVPRLLAREDLFRSAQKVLQS